MTTGARSARRLSVFAVVAVFALGVGSLAGCASQVSKFLGFGEPVTQERCASFSMYEFGRKDGTEARRPGEKFESWQQDCRAFGVKFDRAEYDRGYADGLQDYCSCEKGFTAGVKGGFAELRGQYFMCGQADYANFRRGHELGRKLEKDPELVRVITVAKTEYDEAAIARRATAACAALPEVQAQSKEGRLHIALKIESQYKIAGPQVIARLVYTNHTAQPVRFVNWVVGRGKAPSNAHFTVSEDGREIVYQGMMAKRVAPTEKDFVVLAPGESLADEVDLSESYPWRRGPHRYRVMLKTSARDPRADLELLSEEAVFSF